MSLIGEVVHYCRDQADVDAGVVRPLHVCRQELEAGVAYVHGVLATMRGSQYARVVGDPMSTGANPDGIARAPIVASPAAGSAIWKPVIQGCVTNRASAPFPSFALTANNWQTVTGGTLSSGAVMIAYNSGNGQISVDREGVYWITAGLSVEWTVGITAPRFEAAIWRAAVLTELSGRVQFGGLTEGRRLEITAPLRVLHTQALELRIRASQAVTVEVTDFAVALLRC